ncbi:hypothetical protein vseg_002456 [Gypsophila vaccaria]
MMNQLQRYKLFVIFNFITLVIGPINSFSLKSFNGDENSNFTLLNDAQIAGTEGTFVNLTTSAEFSSGQIVYKKPFNFIDSKTSKFVSFSSEFSFSITPGDGDGMIFLIFPSDVAFSDVFDEGHFGVSKKVEHKFVGIEFDTRKHHVGVDVGSYASSEIRDMSVFGLIRNGGVSLRSWVDYEASSKRLEVRLAEDGSERPYNPFVSYGVDLSKMWEGKDVLVGFSSSNGNSSQISSLSSWKFEIRTVPSSMHSEPLDPEVGLEGDRHLRRRKNCFLTVLGVVIFATGCGTLVAFLALFAWVIFFGRHSNVVPELPMNVVDFKYEKVNVTVDNVADDSMRSSATC